MITLCCPECGKKAGRAVKVDNKRGRVCVNCGFRGTLEDFVIIPEELIQRAKDLVK